MPYASTAKENRRSDDTAKATDGSRGLADASVAQHRADLDNNTTTNAHKMTPMGVSETENDADMALLNEEHDAASASLSEIDYAAVIEDPPLLARDDIHNNWEPRCVHCGRANEWGNVMCDAVLPRVCQSKEEYVHASK